MCVYIDIFSMYICVFVITCTDISMFLSLGAMGAAGCSSADPIDAATATACMPYNFPFQLHTI